MIFWSKQVIYHFLGRDRFPTVKYRYFDVSTQNRGVKACPLPPLRPPLKIEKNGKSLKILMVFEIFLGFTGHFFRTTVYHFTIRIFTKFHPQKFLVDS